MGTKIKPLIIILLYMGSPAYCQNESAGAGKAFRFDITGGFIAQKALAGNEEFSTPEYLSVRRPTEPGLASLWGLNSKNVTDNPLGHAPMYMRLHSWYNPAPELELYFSMEADHRGMSWGPYNTDNIAYLSRFHAAYDKRHYMRAIGDSIDLEAKVGYFENMRNYEGLTLYNIDVQGITGKIRHKKYYFSASQYGDLIRGYGLGIDGVIDLQTGLLGLGSPESNWRLDIKTGTQKMIGFAATGGDSRIYSLAVAGYKDNIRIYAEAGYRETKFSALLDAAAVTGIASNYNLGRFNADLRAEYRYYGGGFNYQFRNEQATHFRDISKPAGANFIGDMVYPMSFYGRPFSQWAVYTEYDKAWVQSGTVYSLLSYKLTEDISLFADLDFNLIKAEGEPIFLYPFYNCGLKATLFKDTYAGISITNRTMNLDKHYTTYYLTVRPLLQFELKKNL